MPNDAENAPLLDPENPLGFDSYSSDEEVADLDKCWNQSSFWIAKLEDKRLRWYSVI
jgi:hypothetical protein